MDGLFEEVVSCSGRVVSVGGTSASPTCFSSRGEGTCLVHVSPSMHLALQSAHRRCSMNGDTEFKPLALTTCRGEQGLLGGSDLGAEAS